MRARRILVISLVAMLCALGTLSVTAMERGPAPDVEPPASAVEENESDSFSIFMRQFDKELAEQELDSGPPPSSYEPPPDVPPDSPSMADDLHMIRAYMEIFIYIVIPVIVIALVCWFFYVCFVRSAFY